jgi:Outer membrane protein beta-barrel domain
MPKRPSPAAGLSVSRTKIAGLFLAVSLSHSPLNAESRRYGGALIGISTLSADGRSSITPAATAVSLYKPENGPALNLFGGVHLTEYISLQGNYVWNRNDLLLTSTQFSDANQILYEQNRGSSQQSIIADFLLYFRNRQSRFRPYLSAGTGFVHFKSRRGELRAIRGSPTLPPESFVSSMPVLRVAVGIDVAVSRNWSFRYCFSETINKNPISRQLSPPGQRNLANFQNLFGLVRYF